MECDGRVKPKRNSTKSAFVCRMCASGGRLSDSKYRFERCSVHAIGRVNHATKNKLSSFRRCTSWCWAFWAERRRAHVHGQLIVLSQTIDSIITLWANRKYLFRNTTIAVWIIYNKNIFWKKDIYSDHPVAEILNHALELAKIHTWNDKISRSKALGGTPPTESHILEHISAVFFIDFHPTTVPIYGKEYTALLLFSQIEITSIQLLKETAIGLNSLCVYVCRISLCIFERSWRVFK